MVRHGCDDTSWVPNLEKIKKLTWTRRMLATFRCRREGPSMGPSMSSADQFSGDVLPTNTTPMKLLFLYFLDTFWTQTLNYALANTSNKKKATKLQLLLESHKKL